MQHILSQNVIVWSLVHSFRQQTNKKNVCYWSKYLKYKLFMIFSCSRHTHCPQFHNLHILHSLLIACQCKRPYINHIYIYIYSFTLNSFDLRFIFNACNGTRSCMIYIENNKQHITLKHLKYLDTRHNI